MEFVFLSNCSQACYYHPVSQPKGVSERLGGHLATGWGQLTTDNKFLKRNGREDFQRSSLLSPNISVRGHIRITESLRLEIPPGSSPTFDQIPPWPLNHIMKCHIYACFEHLFPLRVAAKTNVFLSLEQIHQNPVSKEKLTKWHSSEVLTSFKEWSGCLNGCLVYKIFECRQVSHNCTKLYSFSQLSQKPVYNWKTEICSTIHHTNVSTTNLSFRNHLFLL